MCIHMAKISYPSHHTFPDLIKNKRQTSEMTRDTPSHFIICTSIQYTSTIFVAGTVTPLWILSCVPANRKNNFWNLEILFFTWINSIFNSIILMDEKGLEKLSSNIHYVQQRLHVFYIIHFWACQYSKSSYLEMDAEF